MQQREQTFILVCASWEVGVPGSPGPPNRQREKGPITMALSHRPVPEPQGTVLADGSGERPLVFGSRFAGSLLAGQLHGPS